MFQLSFHKIPGGCVWMLRTLMVIEDILRHVQDHLCPMRTGLQDSQAARINVATLVLTQQPGMTNLVASQFLLCVNMTSIKNQIISE